MKKAYRFNVLLVSLIVVAAGLIPAVAYETDAKHYEKGIIEYKLQKSSADSVQEWIDGELTLNAGLGSEWYIIALSNHGSYDFSRYTAALNGYLSENEVGSASTRLKYALTYVAVGDKSNPYIKEALGNSVGEQGIMSLVFGLHLLNNGYECNAYTSNRLIDEILSAQLADGGWTVAGEYGDVDVTAMTVQALADHCNSNRDVDASVECALDFLSLHQLENGGYSAYGVENPESTAQVIIALSSLNIDAAEDDRFIKNGNTVFDGIEKFCLDDGSFCHREGGASDSMASSQVLCASIAYENMTNGKPPFYIFKENIPETTKLTVTTEKASLTRLTAPATSESAVTAAIDSNTALTVLTEAESQTVEQQESRNAESDSVKLIIISVCAVSVLICAVLFGLKKYKLIVLVIITVAAAIAINVFISDKTGSDIIGSVTITIRCDEIKNENKSYIPSDGTMLEITEVEIEDGDTVYDVFSEVCEENDILFSANMKYIEGINNIYEKDFGKASGWIYFVNGEFPSVGCGNYELSDGDEIRWCYTRDPGADLDTEFEKDYN